MSSQDARKPGFSSLKMFYISALVLKQNKNCSAQIKNFFNEEKPGFLSS